MRFKEIDGVMVSVLDKEMEGISFVDPPSGEDDSELIQESLNSGAGGKVILPPYSYKVSKTIYVPENTFFEGLGLNSQIELTDSGDLDEIPFRTHTSSTNVIKPIITNERPKGVLRAQGVHIKNIHVKGEGAVESSDARLGGIVFLDAEKCQTENVYVNYINWSEEHNIAKRGFALACARSRNITFNRGMLDHAGYECFGVYDDSENVIATNMLIKNGMRCSAQIHQNVRNITFSNNILMLDKGNDNTNGCFVMHGREDSPLKNILISNNQMTTTVDRTSLISSVEYQGDVFITDNILNGTRDGIVVNGINYDFMIKDNKINVGRTGIKVSVSLFGASSINDNNITSGEDGIHINRCDALMINSNNLKSGGYGMRLTSEVNSAVVDGNIIDAKEGAFHEDYSNREEIMLGTNMVI